MPLVFNIADIYTHRSNNIVRCCQMDPKIRKKSLDTGQEKVSLYFYLYAFTH